MTSPMDRIQVLENIEKDIGSVLHSSGLALNELSKDKPANKHLDTHVQSFIKTLTNVETELSKQINYLTQVSTGQAHEGSSYSAQKTLQMTWHRLEHIRTEVNKLEKLKNNQRMRQPQQQQVQQHQSNQSSGNQQPTIAVSQQQPNLVNAQQQQTSQGQGSQSQQSTTSSNQYSQQFQMQPTSHQSPNRPN